MVSIRKFANFEAANQIVIDLLAFCDVAETPDRYRKIYAIYHDGLWCVVFRKDKHTLPYVLTNRGFVYADYLAEKLVLP
jgi:hypothetical protein